MESTIENNTTLNPQNAAVVPVAGRLDALEAGSLRQVLQEHIDRGTVFLVVDLSAADFVDSAGLAALVRAMKQARTNGGDVRLVAPKSAEAMRVFELTRFDQVFDIMPTVERALAQW